MILWRSSVNASNPPQSPQTARKQLPVLQQFRAPNIRIKKVRTVFERFVPKPENVEINFVPFEQVLVGESLKPVAFLAFEAVFGMKALDELVEIRAF